MIDVGANAGTFTKFCARIVGTEGRVLAFEPGPDNLTQLRKRCRALPQVSIVEAAVSDHRGRASFYLDRDDGTQHSLSTSNVGDAASGAIDVAVVMLDDYMSELPRVDLLKIDAQGADLHVLRGARQMLKTWHPQITVELWPSGLRNMGTEPMDLVAELKASGYDVHRLSAKGLLKSEDRIVAFVADAGLWGNINLVARPQRLARAF